jgi:hypothetical protein
LSAFEPLRGRYMMCPPCVSIVIRVVRRCGVSLYELSAVIVGIVIWGVRQVRPPFHVHVFILINYI